MRPECLGGFCWGGDGGVRWGGGVQSVGGSESNPRSTTSTAAPTQPNRPTHPISPPSNPTYPPCRRAGRGPHATRRATRCSWLLSFPFQGPTNRRPLLLPLVDRSSPVCVRVFVWEEVSGCIYMHTCLSFNQSNARPKHWVLPLTFQPHSSAAPLPLAGGRVSLPPNHWTRRLACCLVSKVHPYI